jgi:hypothetical protein
VGGSPSMGRWERVTHPKFRGPFHTSTRSNRRRTTALRGFMLVGELGLLDLLVSAGRGRCLPWPGVWRGPFAGGLNLLPLGTMLTAVTLAGALFGSVILPLLPVWRIPTALPVGALVTGRGGLSGWLGVLLGILLLLPPFRGCP